MKNEIRVVITGWGLNLPGANPSGYEAWQAVLDGRPMIVKVENPSWAPNTPNIAGVVRDKDIKRWFQLNCSNRAKEYKDLDPFAYLALPAAKDAITSAQLTNEIDWRADAPCIIGSGIGGMETWEKETLRRGDGIHGERKEARDFEARFVPKIMPNSAAGWVSNIFKLHGNSYAPGSACATGAHAISCLFNEIKAGATVIGLAGGVESTICEYALNSFTRMGALAQGYPRHLQPHQVSRPCALERYGFVMSEGAGIVVLEELEHALSRHAPILAEIVSIGTSSDTGSITQLGPYVGVAMARAIERAGINPHAIDYVNAHATSTAGDPIEIDNIARALQVCGRQTPLAVSSTKSVTGHLMGSAGAVEGIFTVLAISTGWIPATRNLETVDPACDLNGIEHITQSVQRNIFYAMSNSFGFGGHNVSILLKKYHAP